jgi:hypothetical protein
MYFGCTYSVDSAYMKIIIDYHVSADFLCGDFPDLLPPISNNLKIIID